MSGKCAKERVLYQAVCTKCNAVNDEGKEVIFQYIGETSRTLHVRRKQLADFKNCSKTNKDRREENKKSSFIWDHIVETHGGDLDLKPKRDFNFSVLATFKDPLTRQITEAVKIKSFGTCPGSWRGKQYK